MSIVYFKNFPKIVFDGKEITDITKFSEVIEKVKQNTSVFVKYRIRDNQKAEDIAYKAYGDANLYWIVFLFNNIRNPYYDWPLPEEELLTFIVDKYGEGNLYTVHHYETTSQSELGAGVWVNQGTPFSQPVTNYDYEFVLNESRRDILLPKRQFVNMIVDQLALTMKE